VDLHVNRPCTNGRERTRAGTVVTYFTLVGHIIEREVLPRQLGRSSPDRIPAVLIARLALDRAHHRQGLGGALLADETSRIVAATEIVAARFVVVDAIDDNATHFYNHYGYQPLLSDLAHNLGKH